MSEFALMITLWLYLRQMLDTSLSYVNLNCL